MIITLCGLTGDTFHSVIREQGEEFEFELESETCPLIKNSSLISLQGKYLKWLLGFDLGIEFPEIETIQTGNPKYFPFQAIENHIKEQGDFAMIDCIEQQKMYGFDEYQLNQQQAQVRWQIENYLHAVRDLHQHLQQQEPPTDPKYISSLETQRLWDLPVPQRRELYSLWRNEIEEKWEVKLRDTENDIRVIEEGIAELRFHKDLDVLRKCDVVGLTTTGAARLHEMLKKLRCQIGESFKY